MVDRQQKQVSIDIQDLKSRLADVAKKIAILRGYL